MTDKTVGEAVEQRLPRETLKIRNFLSIRKADYEFAQFNIITGGMASGKSLTIKLLKYFQDVITRLFYEPNNFYNYLEGKTDYFNVLKEKFLNIFALFTLQSLNSQFFEIEYMFSCGGNEFSMRITGKNKDDIDIESSYLKNILEKWRKLAIEKKKLLPEKMDSPEEFIHTFYDAMQTEFNHCFPIYTTFVPASRATLMYYKNSGLKEKNYFLDKYYEWVESVKKNPDTIDYVNTVNEMLKAKIQTENDNDLSISLLSSGDRKVPFAYASNGQQEILYILIGLSKLNNCNSYYEKVRSLFIEEPEAQLYPFEQMKIINFIVQVYNDRKENKKPIRFFITTHSPYVLNSLNNILRKGALLKKYPEQDTKINENEIIADTPVLFAEKEVSAYFIDEHGNGNDMFDPKDKDYIYPKEINKISHIINDIDELLSDLDDDLDDKFQE